MSVIVILKKFLIFEILMIPRKRILIRKISDKLGFDILI